MLKFVFAATAMAAASQAASQGVEHDTATNPSAIEADALDTRIIDPDHNRFCDQDPLLVQGAEGDAEIFRDPARPDALKPMRAVGYQIDGCSLLVMTDGSLRRPADGDGPVTLQPAQ